LFRPPPDDWPRIEEKRNYYKNLNITARANIKRTPEAGCSYTYEPESDSSVIIFVDLFKKILSIFSLSLLFDTIFLPYRCLIDSLYIILASLRLKSWSDGSAITACNEPQVRVELPPSIHSDSNWIGLALFASFSVCEHSLAILEDLEQETYLLCCLESDVDSIEPHHVYRPTRADSSCYILVGSCGCSIFHDGHFQVG
jgi:hypothetical protein